MSLGIPFPRIRRFYRAITAPLARRFNFSMLALLFLVTATARVRSALLLRQISPVVSGMARIQVDHTTEEDLVRMVPGLVRTNQNSKSEHFYYIAVSNESDWLMRHLVFGAGPEWLLQAWDLLGYRYLYFEASAIVLDGKVSHVHYGIATTMAFPREASYIVSAKSAHGYWAARNLGFWVTSELDESPQYSVIGDYQKNAIRDRKGFLKAVFTPDTPPELTSHAFHVDLSCFWGLRGCRSARQVSPQLWQDKINIEAAVVSRLKGREPCPDRVLAGRVRYLPDVDVLLLRVTHFRRMPINMDDQDSEEFITDYDLVEVIRGRSTRNSWKGVRYNPLIPSPADPLQRIANPMSPLHQVGDLVVMFSNHHFYSCQVVPATPSALSALRAAIPAPRYPEDELVSLQ